MNQSEVFKAAVKLAPHERNQYLDQVCGNDPLKRAELESLLRAHDTAESFLERPARGVARDANLTSDYQPISEGPGSVIGPYRLMEQVGEGGFGLVFVAQQTEPVRRKVALKIIKPGMDTKEVIARFEAERQALALMDHPNIAKVLDAGTTASGRPYFVMELIRGIQIVEYCDDQRLSMRERLKLFVAVCRAVQHAHSKGVIHRDLKPSNILVSPHDGVPVPKVIDFGIAKAIGQQLTDKTIYTRLTQMIGTPLYMSPEQAEINALDVDTRSDVYSLGVLLYELLTGTTPFDSQRFSQAAYEEIKRIIREEDPPTPSRRLKTLGESLTAVSKHRNSEPARLTASVAGELDWIVMKSLEKERNRRYETASALAADVDRFLNNEVVEARPVSRLYRIQKFVRRNRAIVVSTGTVILALVFGLGLVIYKANQLNAALKRWRHELEMNALDAALGGKIERAETFIADAREAGVSTETIEWLTGLVELSQGQAKNCILRLENLQTSGTLKIPAHVTLAMAYMENGQLPEYYAALEHLRSAVPVEDADYILWGEARWMWDLQGETIDQLNEGLRRRDTPVVRALCARAMVLGGICQPDKELSQALVSNAVKHIGVAEAMAGDLPLVRDISVLVHHGALSVCPAEDRDMHLRLAQEAVATPAESALGKLYRAGFLLDHGDVDRAIQLFEEATRECDSPAYFLAPALFLRSPSMALKEFMVVPFPNPAGPGALGGKAFLLALTPGRQSEAIALADKIVIQYADYDTRIDALCASLLAGDKNVVNKSRNLQSTSYANFHHCDKMLAHLAETDDPEKLESVIRNSNGGHVANYVMGVKLLAAGDRAGARKYLELSAKIPILNSSYPLYSRAILKQMHRAKNWPEWLPSREQPLPNELGVER